MGKNSLGMNQKTLQQLLSNPDHSLNLDELFSSYKTIMPTLDIMSNSTIIQEALKATNKFGNELSQNLRLISTQAAQVAQATQLFNSYKPKMPIFDSTIIQEALRTVQIPSSTFQFLSTIDIEEIQTFLEEREVQEEIQQEITSIQEETSIKKVIDFINEMFGKRRFYMFRNLQKKSLKKMLNN